MPYADLPVREALDPIRRKVRGRRGKGKKKGRKKKRGSPGLQAFPLQSTKGSSKPREGEIIERKGKGREGKKERGRGCRSTRSSLSLLASILFVSSCTLTARGEEKKRKEKGREREREPYWRRSQ